MDSLIMAMATLDMIQLICWTFASYTPPCWDCSFNTIRYKLNRIKCGHGHYWGVHIQFLKKIILWVLPIQEGSIGVAPWTIIETGGFHMIKCFAYNLYYLWFTLLEFGVINTYTVSLSLQTQIYVCDSQSNNIAIHIRD